MSEFTPWSPLQEKIGKFFIKRYGKLQVKIYELTGGRLMNTFLGAPCAILTTTGAKTGAIRKTPLLYLKHKNDIIMVASQGGFSSTPFWYRNLQKNPDARIQIGSDISTVKARDASDSEKQALWPLLDAMYSGYAEYRARTDGVREIPIVIFSTARS